MKFIFIKKLYLLQALTKYENELYFHFYISNVNKHLTFLNQRTSMLAYIKMYANYVGYMTE